MYTSEIKDNVRISVDHDDPYGTVTKGGIVFGYSVLVQKHEEDNQMVDPEELVKTEIAHHINHDVVKLIRNMINDLFHIKHNVGYEDYEWVKGQINYYNEMLKKYEAYQ